MSAERGSEALHHQPRDSRREGHLMKLNRAFVCALGLLAFLGWTVAEESSSAAPPGLISSYGMEGLRDVQVVVEDIDGEFERTMSVSRERVQTQTELYLRKIPEVKVSDSAKLCPYVYININATVVDGPHNLSGGQGSILVALVQPAMLLRAVPTTEQPIWVSSAATWWNGTIFQCTTGVDGGEHVLQCLTHLLDDFQNQYLKANPDVKP